MYVLSREIPKHKKTVKIRQAKRDGFVMSKRFRQIRAGSQNSLDACFWCGYKFENGETMGLAIMEKGRNKVICDTCFDAMQEESKAKA